MVILSRKLLPVFLFILVSVFSAKSFAVVYDPEFAEASKCGRYFSIYEATFHMPSNMLKAVGITESGKYNKAAGKMMAWPWTVNAKGKGYYFGSKREAIMAVRKFQAQGIKSIDVGCMQINMQYHPDAFRNLEQAFEPKYNIGYAAKFLRDKYLQARNWKDAIGLYHNADPQYGNAYIKRVYATWSKEDKSSIQVASLGRPSISVSNAPKAADADVSDITRSVLNTFAR